MPSSISITNLGSEFQITKDNTETFVAKTTKTVTGTSGNFLPGALNDATTHIFWQLRGADMDVRFDAEDATTSDMLIEDKDSAIWSRQLATDARVIRDDTTNGTIIIYEVQQASPITAQKS